jgi:hypothetical protein
VDNKETGIFSLERKNLVFESDDFGIVARGRRELILGTKRASQLALEFVYSIVVLGTLFGESCTRRGNRVIEIW